jgi:hypothetical protein
MGRRGRRIFRDVKTKDKFEIASPVYSISEEHTPPDTSP